MLRFKVFYGAMFIVVINIFHTFTLAPNTAPLHHNITANNNKSDTNKYVVYKLVNESMARNVRGAFLAKNTAKQKQVEQSGGEKPSKVATNPRFAHSKVSHIRFDPKQYACTEWNRADCKNKTQQYKEKLLLEFKKSSLELSEEPNLYFVSYTPRPTFLPTKCLVLNAKVKTLRKDLPPFNTNLLGTLLPRNKLLGRFKKVNGRRPSCIMVSSAGSVKGSRMGGFIGKLNHSCFVQQIRYH